MVSTFKTRFVRFHQNPTASVYNATPGGIIELYSTAAQFVVSEGKAEYVNESELEDAEGVIFMSELFDRDRPEDGGQRLVFMLNTVERESEIFQQSENYVLDREIAYELIDNRHACDLGPAAKSLHLNEIRALYESSSFTRHDRLSGLTLDAWVKWRDSGVFEGSAPDAKWPSITWLYISNVYDRRLRQALRLDIHAGMIEIRIRRVDDIEANFEPVPITGLDELIDGLSTANLRSHPSMVIDDETVIPGLKPGMICLGRIDVLDDWRDLRVFLRSEENSKVVSSAKAETDCRNWLNSLKNKTMSKTAYRKNAMEEFSGLSAKAFDRAWAIAFKGNENWTKAGRRTNSND